MDSKSNAINSLKNKNGKDELFDWEFLDQSRSERRQLERSNVNEEIQYSPADSDFRRYEWTGPDALEKGSEFFSPSSALKFSIQRRLSPSREQEYYEAQVGPPYLPAPASPTPFNISSKTKLKHDLPNHFRWSHVDHTHRSWQPSANSNYLAPSGLNSPDFYSFSPDTSFQQRSNYTEAKKAWEARSLIEEATLSLGELCLEDQKIWVRKYKEHTSITNPEGYFKLGRIFETIWPGLKEGSKQLYTFVVMNKHDGDCSECCLLDDDLQADCTDSQNCAVVFDASHFLKRSGKENLQGLGEFPILIENRSVKIAKELQLDFSRVYTIYHDIRLRNVGRIDRKYLKSFETTFLGTARASPSEVRESREEILGSHLESKSPKIPPGDQSSINSHISQRNDYAETGIPRMPTGSLISRYSRLTALESTETEDQILTRLPIGQENDHTEISTPRIPTGSFIPRYSTLTAPESSETEDSEISFKSHMISSSSPIDSSSSLLQEYQIHPSKHFKIGKVLKILWSEPAGFPLSSAGITDEYSKSVAKSLPSKFGENAYHSVRRFVVIKARDGHCLCVPIFTYGFRGTAKPGVVSRDHAIIYTTKEAPNPIAGELSLLKRPIRMVPDRVRDGLAVSSRINYNKIYTVEHNVKVCFIGQIAKDSMAIFLKEFNETFEV